MVRSDEPKKSETLEVRISHQVKQALQQRARTEERPVSDVVRSLIAGYLGDGDTGGTATLSRWERFASLVTVPRFLLAMVAGTAGLLLFGQPLSYADALNLELGGTFLATEGEPAQKSVHSFDTVIALTPGGEGVFVLGSEDEYRISVQSATLEQAPGISGDLRLDFTIEQREGDAYSHLFERTTTISFGQNARVEVMAADGSFYSLIARIDAPEG